MIAECLNEQEFAGGEAFTHLNNVRERTGVSAKTAGNVNTTLM